MDDFPLRSAYNLDSAGGRLKMPRLGPTAEMQHPNLGFDPLWLSTRPPTTHDHVRNYIGVSPEFQSFPSPTSHTYQQPDRPASKYAAAIEPLISSERVVACDGGDPDLGHPRVYINLDKTTIEDPAPCGTPQPFLPECLCY